ncbi:uncharacterized mitochondrial protein AtMg00810-like [Rutidosis leptorrhynchoides]|uniref:uncharacterized mitochondrial protein AtMg00810-like n=1 Tax=Rutidosis leptorrhynchoides TaxID=125765 RepID=UPI003A9A4A84
MKHLSTEFGMKHLGGLSYFLGFSAAHTETDPLLNQSKYAHEILDKADMLFCKSENTSTDTNSWLSSHAGAPYSDPMYYRSLVGALQYLTFTQPNIAYAVQQICLHMHAPFHGHMGVLNRILRYVQGTIHFHLHMYRSTSHNLRSYTDTDWAGYTDTR